MRYAAGTALGLLVWIAVTQAAPIKMDVVFCLDVTGSMSGEIREAKERIHEIAADLTRSEPPPQVRFGLVAYRDRDDEFVTRSFPMTVSLGRFADQLALLSAEGGGDCPEAVVEALQVALEETDWDPDPATERLVYLVGDAPYHADQEDHCRQVLAMALRKGVVLHSILCRDSCGARQGFRRIALATEGCPHVMGCPEPGTPGTPPAPTENLTALLTASLQEEADDAGVEYRRERLPWEVLLEAPVSGLRGRSSFLVRDAATWSLVQGIHDSPLEELPVRRRVDFATRSVIVLARGTSTDPAVPRVQSLRSGPDGPAIHVEWEPQERVPSAGGSYSPCLMILVPAQPGRLQVHGRPR